jgi:hypothetical protein
MRSGSTIPATSSTPSADPKVVAEANRNCDILAMLIIPWVLWLFVSWPDTPLGAVDAWIYRGLAQSFKMSYYLYPDYYYTCRFYVLIPEWVLNHIVSPYVAHVIMAFAYCYGSLLGIYDFATSLGATARTRTLLALLPATSLFLLRTFGWGYIDGFIVTVFCVGMACMARSLIATTTGRRCLWAAAAGALLLAMVLTHSMAALLGLTLIWFFMYYNWLLHRGSLLRRLVETTACMLVGGLAGLLAVCLIAQWRFGHFLFFMPIIKATIFLSKGVSGFKVPVEKWSPRADWLLIQAVAFAGSALFLALALLRRIRLTRFEVFAYCNALLVLGAAAVLESFTQNVFLQYSYYACYFLPASFLAIAAMFGECTTQRVPLRWKAPLALLLILLAVISLAAKQPFLNTIVTPGGNQGPPPPTMVNVFYVQLALGCAGVLILLLARFDTLRSAASLATLTAAVILCGLAIVPPISHYPSPTLAADIRQSRDISITQQAIQRRVGLEHPLFWYSDKSPFYWEFSSVHSAFLWWQTHLDWTTFPNGPLPGKKPASTSIVEYKEAPWAAGDRIVIMTEHPEQLAQVRTAFATIGMDLDVTDQFANLRDGAGYSVIFALTKPGTGPHLLRPDAVPTAIFYPETLRSAAPDSHLLEQPGSAHKIRQSHAAGYLSFGPYTKLPPGNYRVQFTLACDALTPPDDNVTTVDVFSAASKQPPLAARTIHAHDFTAPHAFQSFAVDVTVTTAISDAEFRVLTFGTHDVELQSITLTPMH